MSGLVPGVKDRLSATQWAGAGVLLAAALLAELGPRLLAGSEAQEAEPIG